MFTWSAKEPYPNKQCPTSEKPYRLRTLKYGYSKSSKIKTMDIKTGLKIAEAVITIATVVVGMVAKKK